MASAFPVVVVLFVVAGLMTASWIFVRKGPQQTCVPIHPGRLRSSLNVYTSRRLIRTSLMLTFACCYLMWAIAYLAQLHPLEGALTRHIHYGMETC
ncbi:ATP synthase subunit H-domain-containing protein [Multifurca ochricompacta]|uniref:ATP synthase subunit H-domain-containing protein n=1 Tax=Multifurca ochricompacta TaxID=376703 RepID=A0AAD4M8V8_9AGAM|nr:ATP synthase subunit H-domain-containing protein [Multifurca ochricompacta]